MTSRGVSQVGAICSLLRGEAAEWPGGVADRDVDGFLSLARAHGVTALLDGKLAAGGAGKDWPESVRQACRQDALAWAMQELAGRAELSRVLGALAVADVAPLILKGTALAYTHYAAPALRARGDTDLLIPTGSAEACTDVLEGLGYVRGPYSNGEVVSCQATWSRTDTIGVEHHLDVHWRASNSRVLAREFSYDELLARARPVPALGPDARTLAPPDALLFACAHWAGHVNTTYYSGEDIFVGGDRLIWLYDMHLLLRAMSTDEVNQFCALAGERRLREICLRAITLTRKCLGTPIPPAALEVLGSPGPAERSARYLAGRRANQMLGDFVSMEDWTTRLKWLKELGFPDERYMLHKYPQARIRWLPVLYVRRAFEGARKVLLRRGAGHTRF